MFLQPWSRSRSARASGAVDRESKRELVATRTHFVGDTTGDWGRPNLATAENLPGKDVAIGRLDASGN